ncbi:MAG: hypothetical protein EYC70_06370 [Planctomycetota bacterium]|nr:MAG: hypothetical protein EYC70_06370 [Planctomycetota bacterium]
MLRFVACCCLFLAPAGSLLAQNAREPAQVPDFGGQPTGAAYATGVEDGYAVAAHTYPDTPGVTVAFLDERGEPWSQPVVRYSDPNCIGLCPTIMVIEEIVFVCWIERVTNGSVQVDALYYDVTEENGEVWRGPEQMAGDPTMASESVLDFAVTRGADQNGRSYIYVLALLEVQGAPNDELVLFAANAEGGPFSPPVHVPDRMPQAADVDQIALSASPGRIHVAWTDDRAATAPANDLYYRSLLAGTPNFAPEQRLTLHSQVFDGDLLLAAERDRVAAAWLATLPSANQILRAIASDDGGSTFGAAQIVGGYAPPGDDVDDPSLAVGRTDRSAMLAWSDDRTGQDMVYAAALAQGSSQWSADSLVFDRPASRPTVAPSNLPGGPVLATAVAPDGYFGFFSFDQTRSWTSAFPLAPMDLGFESLVSLAHDSRYNDFTISWLALAGGQLHQYVGGVRPQTLNIDGAISQGAPASFEVIYFPTYEAGLAFQVLISGGYGTLRLPGDGRYVGLRNDILFRSFLLRPELRGVLDSTGAGRTQPIQIPLPAGTRLYLVAVSGNAAGFGSITDVLQTTVGP